MSEAYTSLYDNRSYNLLLKVNPPRMPCSNPPQPENSDATLYIYLTLRLNNIEIAINTTV